MKTKLPLQLGVLSLIIFVAAFSRVIPHMPNFSPLGAIALFGAAHLARKSYALLIPIAATWLSDLFINNVVYAAYYPSFTWFYEGFYWQYGSYLLIVLFGGLLLSKSISLPRVGLGALGASSIFFLVSNFGVWAGGSLYPKTLEGLLLCYTAGLPFLQGTLLGDVLFSAVLFGGYYLLQRRFEPLRPTHLSYSLVG